MRVIPLLGAILLAASLCLADDLKPDLFKKELAQLEGNWRMTSYEYNGKKEPAETFRETRPMLQVRGRKMTFRLQDKTLWEGDFTIDPRKAPKILDVTIIVGDDQGKRMLAIYDLEGDHWKIASARLDAKEPKRPSEFRSEPDGTVVSGYSREKK